MASITIGDDLLLRNYTPEDAPGLFAAVDASRKHLHPWLSWVDKTTKEEHSLQYIQDSLYGPFTKEALVLGILLPMLVAIMLAALPVVKGGFIGLLWAQRRDHEEPSTPS